MRIPCKENNDSSSDLMNLWYFNDLKTRISNKGRYSVCMQYVSKLKCHYSFLKMSPNHKQTYYSLYQLQTTVKQKTIIQK